MRVIARLKIIILLLAFLLLHLTVLSPVAAQTTNCDINLSTWTTGPNLPYMHLKGPSAFVNGKFYLIGGFKNSDLQVSDRVDVYNAVTNIWETASTPRRPVPEAMSHSSVVVDGKYIWILGGFLGTNPGKATEKVWKYDTEADLWYSGPALPQKRAAAGAVLHGRNIHFFGGSGSTRDYNYAEHWVLNLDNTAAGWQSAPSMPQARMHFGTEIINGVIYAAGGQFNHDKDSIDQNMVHAFNIATGQWSQKASMALPRSHTEGGTLVISNKLVIIGGRANQSGYGNGQLSQASEYNPATNTWRELTPMPGKLISPNGFFYNNKVYMTAGGSNWQTGNYKLYISNVSYSNCSGAPTSVPPTATPTSTTAANTATPTSTSTSQPSTGNCPMISPLDCGSVPVNLPLLLIFNGGAGGLNAGNAAGTGFTMVDPPSARLAEDGSPSFAGIAPGYEPAKLNLSSGNLTITTTKGIQYRNPGSSANTNSQLNALGVGFDYNGSAPLRLETTLLNPNFATSTGNQSQQGGLWFGLNENNYAKLVLVKSSNSTAKIQLMVENFGSSTSGSLPQELNTTSFSVNGSHSIRLILEIDPATNKVKGYYSVNGGELIQVVQQSSANNQPALGTQTLNIPATFLAGVDHDANGATPAISYGGIFGTNRNSDVPMNFVFTDFQIAPVGVTIPVPTNTSVPPTATNTQVVPSATPTSTPTDTGVPATATPTSTPTDTGVPATATDTPTATDTGGSATATATDTSVPATATPTSTTVPPTATPTSTGVPATATPSITPTPVYSISNVRLINADTDQVIGNMGSTYTINCATIGTPRLNIRALTNPSTVGSVRFGWDKNTNYVTENGAPYAIGQNKGSDYLPWTPPANGVHTLTITPFTGANRTGDAGIPTVITLTISNCSTSTLAGSTDSEIAQLIEPQPQAEVSPANLVFTWKAQPDAVSYRLVIKREGKKKVIAALSLPGSDICEDGICQLNATTFNPELKPGKVYQWRVVTKTAAGKVKSEKQTFIVQTESRQPAESLIPLP